MMGLGIEYEKAVVAFNAAGSRLDKMLASGIIDIRVIDDIIAASDKVTEARLKCHRLAV